MNENCWIHENECLESPPEGYYGFIYCITDDLGRKYWGKKAFTHRTKTKTSKRTRLETGKRIKIGTRDSKWLSYWGSCKPLLEYIATKGSTDGFRREIIKLCADKQSLAYWEMHVLAVNMALFREDCWNGNVLCKFFKGKIHK